jgi:hypothetical protein
LIACKEEQEKIEADSWLIDSTDATLYRVLDYGTEEFMNIYLNPEAELFMCWHKDDVKKWADKLTEKCK